MDKYKVICKVTGPWTKNLGKSEMVTTKHFFGLIKRTHVKSIEERVPGPVRDEICIVTSDYRADDDGELYYNLAGYPFGGYNSKYFIRLDEFEETQTEIARNTKTSPN